jgi:hypothetical protein
MSQREMDRRQQQRKRSLDENERSRLGWRLNEFSKLTGVSRVTLWRLAKDDKLKLTYLGKIPIVTDHEARRLGLLPPEAT